MAEEQFKQVEEVVKFKDMRIVAKRYFVDSKGVPQGQYEEMDIHGAVVKRGTLVDGQLEGLVEIKKDPKNYQIISYKNGKKEGLFVEYQNGLLVRRGVYQNDRLEKEENFQYQNGECRHISEFYGGWVDTVQREKMMAKSLADKLKKGR